MYPRIKCLGEREPSKGDWAPQGGKVRHRGVWGGNL